MKYLTILLSLGAAVSAIDAIMYMADVGCQQGKWIGCLNLNPDTCCSLDSGLRGLCACWSAVPREWNIIGRAHENQNCPGNPNFTKEVLGSKTSRACVGNQFIRSVGYGFIGRKMARGIEVEQSKCTSFKKADVLGLADGTRYNLEMMNETERAEFLGHLEDKNTKEEISDAYTTYVIEP